MFIHSNISSDIHIYHFCASLIINQSKVIFEPAGSGTETENFWPSTLDVTESGVWTAVVGVIKILEFGLT